MMKQNYADFQGGEPFLSHISMVAQWSKALLQAAGVDTSIFSAHSVRGRPFLKL